MHRPEDRLTRSNTSIGQEFASEVFRRYETAGLTIDRVQRPDRQITVYGNDQYFPLPGWRDPYKLRMAAPHRYDLEPESAKHPQNLASLEPLEAGHQEGRADVSKLRMSLGRGVSPSNAGSSSFM